jgi:hypothetical protein
MKKLKKRKAPKLPPVGKPQAPLRTKSGVLVTKRVQQVLAGLHVPKVVHVNTVKVERVIDMTREAIVVTDSDRFAWSFPEVTK